MNKIDAIRDENTYFEYQQKEIDYLKKKDKKLSRVIDIVGPVKRKVIPDPFQGLMHTIIGQQISSKAHLTIWDRFLNKFVSPSPQNIAAAPLEQIQSCGVSFRKAGYMRSIALEFVSGALEAGKLREMDDQTLLKTLVALKGLGEWSAEMLLIFTFQRRNILSFGDLAIRRGICMLYKHKEITKELFAKYQKRYSPCGTIASLYLWEAASGKYQIN